MQAVWKESLLPLLYQSLEEGLVNTCDTSHLTPVNELEKRAGEVKVRMESADKGWKFVKAD